MADAETNLEQLLDTAKCCGCGARLNADTCLHLKNTSGALAGIESPICETCAKKHFGKATPGKGIIVKPQNPGGGKKPFWKFW